MPTVIRRSFEIVPAGWKPGDELEGLAFEPFVMDVPATDDSRLALERSSRRAWWTAFHMLGARGIDPDEFQVFTYDDDNRGELVLCGGPALA